VNSSLATPSKAPAPVPLTFWPGLRIQLDGSVVATPACDAPVPASKKTAGRAANRDLNFLVADLDMNM